MSADCSIGGLYLIQMKSSKMNRFYIHTLGIGSRAGLCLLVMGVVRWWKWEVLKYSKASKLENTIWLVISSSIVSLNPVTLLLAHFNYWLNTADCICNHVEVNFMLWSCKFGRWHKLNMIACILNLNMSIPLGSR